MKTLVLVERSNGNVGLYTPNLKSAILIGIGDTLEEAKADLLSALEDVRACYTEEGQPIPEDLQDIEFEYRDYIPGVDD